MALKVGFIGVGGIARRHLESARKREDIAMVAFCDVVPERARKCAEEFNGNAYESFVELYDKEKPDAVIICTPPFAHGDIEEEAARRGIHFFVEKPVAVNMETANRIARIVEETGIITQVGYMYRTAEPIKKVRELLSTRAIAMVQAHYYMPGLPSPGWWPKMELGGGQLVEQATHMLDLGRFLAGEVATVTGRTARVRDWTPPANYQPGSGLLKYSDTFEIPDTTALVMQYESGALGTLSCSLVPQKSWDVGFKVVADGLLVTIEGANARWVGDEEGEMKAGANYPAYVLYEFFDAVMAGKKTEIPYAEGVRSLAVSLAGYESVKRGGAPVALSELVR
ncbi:MAG TPA: Gfo/Idh/MocA family oxidoreductase [Armatimonadetes bacterium]|jgi:predicted dehydrogenase|nr:Gfo/Idh/MocA family oxidoreductase [Armatimonadota bacterium]